MKDLLAPENISVLARLATLRVFLAFDYDGTLAPIGSERDSVRMNPSTRPLWQHVCQLYPCAVISGRSQRDVADRLENAPVKYVVGNHGSEPGEHLESFAEEMMLANQWLKQALQRWTGLEIEDKRYSLAIHYRNVSEQYEVEVAIAEAVAGLPVKVRTVPGKLIVNVVPPRAPHKGDALQSLCRAENADVSLYVGDDVTDEDVFRIERSENLVTVRVGELATSSAGFFLRDQPEIDRLLAALINLRTRPL